MASLVYEDFPGNTTTYPINFEYLEPTDINVGYITTDETLTPITTGWSLTDATTITFTTAPGGTIRIYRVTPVDEPVATFYPSVAIRAIDLNNNFDQCLFRLQELNSDFNELEVLFSDVVGPEGPQGPAGPEGPQGPQGPQGADGIKLEEGLYDPNNPQPCTVAGSALLDSDGNIWVCDGDGLWVETGPVQGPQGPQGGQGPQGVPGSQGAQGDIGPTGSTGEQGPQGPAGQAGTDGTDGAPGPQGLGWTGGSYNSSTGEVTFTSNDGLGFDTGDLRSVAFNYIGNYPSVANLPSSASVGDLAITDDTGNGYVWDGTQWQLVGEFRGPQGPIGPSGTIEAGTTVTTAAGTVATVVNVGTDTAAIFNFTIPTGPQGNPGTEGPTGPAGTIEVGNTFTSDPGTDASVVDVGTPEAAVLNFTIPRGQQGPQGNEGDPGPGSSVAVGTTTTGAPGTVASVSNTGTNSAAVFNFTIPQGPQGVQGNTGESSYQEWLDAGNTGTEQDFLDSLVGPQGPAATIAVGTTTTLAAGAQNTVTNSGTSGAAVFDFGLAPGDTGPAGDSASVAIGSTTTGEPNTPATVTNSGTTSAVVLNFTIPKGDEGPGGPAATVDVGTTTTLPSGSQNEVTNSGTTSAAILDFSLAQGPTGPQGDACTVEVGTTTTSAAGTNASVTNSGTAEAAVLDFTIPTGPNGAAATVAVGTTTTSAAGGNASVTNSGDNQNATLNFVIPTGPGGPAATITAGNTTTTDYGNPASVTNSGTSSAAVFNFTIPEGAQGPAGTDGTDGVQCTATAGTTSTLGSGSSAYVTNVGSATNAVFNFGIPQGPQGPKGNQGNQGDPGPSGTIDTSKSYTWSARQTWNGGNCQFNSGLIWNGAQGQNLSTGQGIYVYANSNGSLVAGKSTSSDSRFKEDVEPLPIDTEDIGRICFEQLKSFEYIHDDEGDHIGVVAQDLQAALLAEGISLDDLGLIRFMFPGEDLLEVRYEELALYVLKWQAARITHLENRISALEANEIGDDATDTTLLQLIQSLQDRVDILEGN